MSQNSSSSIDSELENMTDEEMHKLRKGWTPWNYDEYDGYLITSSSQFWEFRIDAPTTKDKKEITDKITIIAFEKDWIQYVAYAQIYKRWIRGFIQFKQLWTYEECSKYISNECEWTMRSDKIYSCIQTIYTEARINDNQMSDFEHYGKPVPVDMKTASKDILTKWDKIKIEINKGSDWYTVREKFPEIAIPNSVAIKEWINDVSNKQCTENSGEK